MGSVEDSANTDKMEAETDKTEAEADKMEASARPKVMTQRGLEEKLRQLKDKRAATLRSLTKSKNKINNMILKDDKQNLHQVKSACEDLNSLIDNFTLAHDSYCDLLDPDSPDYIKESNYLQEKLGNFLQFRNELGDWIQRTEMALMDECESASSHSSRSKKSKRSSVRSTLSARVAEKTRIAELEIEQKHLKEQQEIQSREKMLQLEKELAKAKARERIFAAEEAEGTQKPSGTDFTAPEITNQQLPPDSGTNGLNTQAPEFQPKNGEQVHPPLSNAQTTTNYTGTSTVASLPPPGHQNSVTTPQTGTQNNAVVTVGIQGSAASTQGPVSMATTHTVQSHGHLPVALTSANYIAAGNPVMTHTAPHFPMMSTGVTHRPPMMPPQVANRHSLGGGLVSTATTFINNPMTALPATYTTGWDYPLPSAMTNSQGRASPVMTELPSSTVLGHPVSNDQLLTALSLPNPEVPKFTGDVTTFRTFMMAFQTRIVSKVRSPVDCLYYLDQHLVGEPKELVSGCFHMDPQIAYDEAIRLLTNEYGDSYKLAMVYIKNLTNWPDVKADDASGLKKLSLFLINCKNAMMGVHDLNVLNHPPNIQSVVLKLPNYLQHKWRDMAGRARREFRMLNYNDLVNFVVAAADTANDPVYGQSKSSTRTKPQNQVGNPKASSSGKSRSATTFATKVENNKGKQCPMCSESHDLDDCKEFNKKTNKEKRNWLEEKQLCFGCFGTDHFSRRCRNKKKCKKCENRHPTSLHLDNFNPKDIQRLRNSRNVTSKSEETTPKQSDTAEATCTATKTPCSVVLHGIVPVKIKQEGGNEVVTYCLLDNGSSGCFISSDLCKQLGASGTATTLRLKTMHGDSKIDSMVLQDLTITSLEGNTPINLPKTYTRDEIPVSNEQIPTPEKIKPYQHLSGIVSQLPTYLPEVEVGLLVGNNCPQALEPLDVIPAEQGLYAMRLRHGWVVMGPLYSQDHEATDNMYCNRIHIHEAYSEELTPASVNQWFELEFNDHIVYPDEVTPSQEDRLFMKKVEEGMEFNNGRFQVPLPFRDEGKKMPNNHPQAEKRAYWLKKRFLRDDQFKQCYMEFMEKIFTKGYAEPVPQEDTDEPVGRIWYLPHHGVYGKNKMRVVFDGSARWHGESLNDQLLQGPDLANNLTGVLTRFRKYPVALVADIESMFFQVEVPEYQRDYLRFLWWKDGVLDGELHEYRMKVHLFGAVSSPSVVNFILKTIGSRAKSDEVRNTLLRKFYVDDCLASATTNEVAIQLAKELREECMAGGFRLTKFCSNSLSVLKSIPQGDHSKEISSLDLDYDDLPTTRTLGVHWKIDSDQFGFIIAQKDKPLTRRGILATTASLYDPLGFVAPVTLPAKKLLQDLCKERACGWDDPIPDEFVTRWKKWLSSLSDLEEIKIDRCFHLEDLTESSKPQLHAYSDASSIGYGSAVYLRTVNKSNDVNVAFVMGKARLAPLKLKSIPRLELSAAVTSVRLVKMIQREIDEDVDVVYHTDSTTVLRCIFNERKRFPVFVGNRVQFIRDFTQTSQWRYVPSQENPADEASRGLKAHELSSTARWLRGPSYLYLDETNWPVSPIDKVQEEDNLDEINICCTNAEQAESVNTTMERIINYFSDWYKLKFAIAVFHKFSKYMQWKVKKKTSGQEVFDKQPISPNDLELAEETVLHWLHKTVYEEELKALTIQDDSGQSHEERHVGKKSSLYRLDPVVQDRMIKVGGRLRRASLPEETKHPVILPKKHHITTLIIRKEHEKLGHTGRNHVLASLRSRYWVINGNSAVRSVINACVKCRRLQSPVQQQKMADLPTCRLDDSLPPFSRTGVDYFGPFVIRQGRKDIKRYGVLFTCLSSRAIHLEVANGLETDTFIHALRRMIARRGNIKELWSDNGTNFTGANNEMKKCLQEMDQERITSSLRQVGITWIFNPPTASNMGGVWERMVRSVRKVMTGLLQEHGSRLDSESFHTLLCEIEAIINSRPITSVSDDPKDVDPITPNHILTLRSTVTVPPPGVFAKEDIYCRKRWRRVQQLANLFWSRWRSEYLVTLQKRNKWNENRRNMKVGDVVLVRDDSAPRNIWPMGRVLETETDNKGYVRAVQLKTQSSTLRRPVNKLVLLVPHKQ